MTPDLLEKFRRELLAFPSADKDVAELSSQECISLCIAAGCKMDYAAENTDGRYMLTARTVNHVGIVKVGGKFIVYERRGE